METPEVPAAGFDAFGLRAEVLNALKNLGYEEPTPIQRETIPALLAGKDVLGQAATGTGKTAAFALPMLQRVSPKDRAPFEAQALVLVPTRELAMQVAEAVQKYGAGLGVNAIAVYGGQEIFQQVRPLKRGADVVVATPGRALDHIRRKTLLLSKVKFVVLDEADEMLDMGFEEDLQLILGELPRERQTALFSATLPSRIAKIAEAHLKDPVRVTIAARSLEAGTLPKIRQAAYQVRRQLKEAALMRVLEWERPQSAIIFCRTRNEVEELTHVLMRSGYEPAALHGGLTQEQRDAVLKRFKDGAVRVLVATDVAARGLHVENLSHVINFDLPTSPEVYVHRIGRTGRAGKEGVALSFLDPRERRLLQNVERQVKQKVKLEAVPTREQLAGRRAETVAEQVKAVMDKPVAVATWLERAQGLAQAGSMEAVAAAALALLQQKLFPPHESDDVDFGSAEQGGRPERGERKEGRERRGGRDEREERPWGAREERPRGPRAGMTALTLSLGARAGVRPQDLVGAIANEADLPSKQISGIRVDEFTSRVEVPSDAVERVMEAMHKTKLRGRKVRVELERDEGAQRPQGAAPRPRPSRPLPASRFAPPADDEVPVEAPAPRFGGKREETGELVADEARPSRFAAMPEGAEAAQVVAAARPSRPRKQAEEAAPPPPPRHSAPRGAKHEDAPRGRFGGKPGRFDRGSPGARFGDRPRFDKGPPRGERFGDKPRFDKGASPGGGRFGDKPRFDKAASPGGGRFGDKPRFDKGASPGSGRFGDKPRFDKGASPGGGRFGDKPRFDKGPPRGDRFGSKPGRFGGDTRDAGKGRFGGDVSHGPSRFEGRPGRMEPRGGSKPFKKR